MCNIWLPGVSDNPPHGKHWFGVATRGKRLRISAGTIYSCQTQPGPGKTLAHIALSWQCCWDARPKASDYGMRYHEYPPPPPLPLPHRHKPRLRDLTNTNSSCYQTRQTQPAPAKFRHASRSWTLGSMTMACKYHEYPRSSSPAPPPPPPVVIGLA